MNTKAKLANVHAEVSSALAELAPLFTGGMKLTFVARHPDHPERYVLVGDDDPAGLAAFFARVARPHGTCDACGYANTAAGLCSRSQCYNAD